MTESVLKDQFFKAQYTSFLKEYFKLTLYENILKY